jgi:hypothetical protein
MRCFHAGLAPLDVSCGRARDSRTDCIAVVAHFLCTSDWARSRMWILVYLGANKFWMNTAFNLCLDHTLKAHCSGDSHLRTRFSSSPWLRRVAHLPVSFSVHRNRQSSAPVTTRLHRQTSPRPAEPPHPRWCAASVGSTASHLARREGLAPPILFPASSAELPPVVVPPGERDARWPVQCTRSSRRCRGPASAVLDAGWATPATCGLSSGAGCEVCWAEAVGQSQPGALFISFPILIFV